MQFDHGMTKKQQQAKLALSRESLAKVQGGTIVDYTITSVLIGVAAALPVKKG